MALLWMINFHHHGEERNWPQWLGYVDRILVCIGSPLWMASVGGVDAIPKLKYKWKACMIGTMAIFFTFVLITIHLLRPKENDHIIEVQATGSAISFRYIEANVTGTLTLFLWKQAIDTIRNKNRCVSIIYMPYLRWKIPRNESESARTF